MVRVYHGISSSESEFVTRVGYVMSDVAREAFRGGREFWCIDGRSVKYSAKSL